MTHESFGVVSRRGVFGLGLAGSATLLAGAVTGCSRADAADGADAAGLAADQAKKIDSLSGPLAALEHETGVTIGVSASNADGRTLRYRSGTVFPMCSTFKVLAVGALLTDRAYDDEFWNTPVRYAAGDVVENSPVTSADPDRSMSYAELADAALRYSDNTAGNLLLKALGGPTAITDFAQSLGARQTRLDRWEPALNEAIPGDPRDSSTPADLESLYRDLMLGDALSRLGRSRLLEWALRNTTSAKRIGAALPDGAELADKTGAGDYGAVNDVGIVFAGHRTISLAIMTRTTRAGATGDNSVVAQAAELAINALW